MVPSLPLLSFELPLFVKEGPDRKKKKPPPTAFFEILDSASDGSIFKNNKVFINHLLLIFKLYAYKSREKMFINLNNLSVGIRKVKIIEKKIALTNSMTAKWHIINNIIP